MPSLISNIFVYGTLAWAAWGNWTEATACSNSCGNGTLTEARKRCKVNDANHCEGQTRTVACTTTCSGTGASTSTPSTGKKAEITIQMTLVWSNS